VHTLGRVHIGNSGYHGWWSDPQSSALFNNNYYISMIVKPWKPRSVFADAAGSSRVAHQPTSSLPPRKHQWDLHDRMNQTSGADDGIPPAYLTSANQMMLNTDMCLLYSDVTAEHALRTFGEEGCCQWAMPNEFVDMYNARGRAWCASPNGQEFVGFQFVQFHRACCTGDVTCDNADTPAGPAMHHVKDFATNDTYWFETFLAAWSGATEVAWPGVLQPLASTCAADQSLTQDEPSFDRGLPARNREARLAAERAAEQARLHDYSSSMEYFSHPGNLSKWHVANPMDSCTVACSRVGKKCRQQHFNSALHEVDTYGKIKALFETLTNLNRTYNDGLSGDWFRIEGMSAESLEAYQSLHHVDASQWVWEEGIGFVNPGGGTTPDEIAYWSNACIHSRYNLSRPCTSPNTFSKWTECWQMPAVWNREPEPLRSWTLRPGTNTTCLVGVDYHGRTVMLPANLADRPYHWRFRGDMRRWYENITCGRDHSPGRSGSFDQALFPSVFFTVATGQIPWEIPSCGAADFLTEDGRRKEVPEDFCDKAYFSPKWRRACPCEELEAPRCSAGSENQSACFHDGIADPTCCSRQISASCAPGHVYFSGEPCKWRTHEQWQTTICCPDASATDEQRNLHPPPITDGVARNWYIAPLGEVNCSKVCDDELVYRGQQVKPSGYICQNDAAPVGQLANFTEIVQGIRWRDWIGAAVERRPPTCGVVRPNQNTFVFAPSMQMRSHRTEDCYHNWRHTSGRGTANACDPNPAAWTQADGWPSSFLARRERSLRDFATGFRRLCMCVPPGEVIARPSPAPPAPPAPQQLPAFATGWVLGPRGMLNCSHVCHTEGRSCGLGGYMAALSRNGRGRMSQDDRTALFANLGLLGSNANLNCPGVNSGTSINSFGPSVQMQGNSVRTCYSGWNYRWWGRVLDFCDPDPESMRSRNFNIRAVSRWESIRSAVSSNRRLCKCV